MNIHYLGPIKTFSEEAATRFSDAQSERIPQPSFEAIAQAVANHDTDRGVLPYYNYLEGLVQESLDLIYEYQLHVSNFQRVPITLSIGGPTPELTGKEVYSHPKALAQCSDFLREHLPDAVLTPVSSTAEAARRAQETGEGLAIARATALQENQLHVLHDDVGNRKHGRANFTDFLLVSRVEASPPTSPARTILAVTPRSDRIGLLADILSSLRFFGVNIAKIHSRPAIDQVATDVEPQMFYLELLCNSSEEPFRRCLDTLNFRFEQVESSGVGLRVLGAFPEAGESAS